MDSYMRVYFFFLREMRDLLFCNFDKKTVFFTAIGVLEGHLWTVKDTKVQFYIRGCFFFLRKTLGSMAPLLNRLTEKNAQVGT